MIRNNFSTSLMSVALGAFCTFANSHVSAQPTAQVTTSTHLTQEQATQLAKAFCRKIGAPVTTAATAEYVVPDGSSVPLAHHWQARWDIKFSTQVEVEVVDATGIVVGYQSFNYSAADPQIGKQPAGQAIPQEEAIRRATQVLAATGQAGELTFWKADLDQDTYPPTVVGHTWIVAWKRQFQGIVYQNEGSNVILDAETGELQALGLIFHAPPPTTARVLVTEDTARQKALAMLQQMGADAPQFLKCEHVVVQPNAYWQGAGPASTTLHQAECAVWSCVYTIGSRQYHVWVDTETGSVIGGRDTGRRGSDPLSFPTLPKKS